jgi:hypothetical protein
MHTLNKNMQLPAPPPGAPGMFRCGNPGFLADLFKQPGTLIFQSYPDGILLPGKS